MKELFFKEIKTLMSSWLALSVALAFQFLSIWFLWISPYSDTIVSAGVADWYPFLNWVTLPLMLVCSVLSLHAFAEEMQRGTYDALFSLPVSYVQIAIAKYYAAAAVLLFVLIPSLFQIFLIRYFALPNIALDYGVFLISFCGILLCGMAFLALGIFATLFARNIWVSWVLGLMIMGVFAQSVVGNFGVQAHLFAFNRGVFSMEDFFYFLNIIVIGIVLITFKLKPR